MTVRDTMADLITRVRGLVGDPVIAGTPPTSTFTDQQVQDALDQHRTEVRYAPLRPLISIAASGTVTWPSWFAPRGNWEDDPILTDASYTPLTPSVVDNATGRWTFAASQPWVLITGFCYDPYGAAVDLLYLTLQSVAAQFDFATDGQSFSRSQQMAGVQSLINAYRVKARPPAISIIQAGTPGIGMDLWRRSPSADTW